jgi:D-alanyl-D-alanine carboxypeptidase (penicillin-binding protein 5/6)
MRSIAAPFAVASVVAAFAWSLTPALGQQPQQQRQQTKPKSGPERPGRVAKPAAVTPESLPASQVGIGTLAKQAYIVDHDTGAVLLWKDADKRMAPSSMAKMMTIYLVFEELKAGRLKLDSRFRVSERAWRMQGSKMFVEVGKDVGIDELLKGTIVQSGNDACIVLAEGLAGTEDAFAERMTRKARDIGMKDTVFRNASGWPAEGQHTTARDLAILAQRTIADFPEFYRFYSIVDYQYGGIAQPNRNLLLRSVPGTDGLKTGHTEEGGYGIASSTARDGRRLIVVVNGLGSMAERARETERITEWAFREHSNVVLFRPGAPVAQAAVWLGAQGRVPLAVTSSVAATVPVGQQSGVKASIVYEGPIKAPIAKGQRVGTLTVTLPGGVSQDHPLVADAEVARLGPVARALSLAKHYILGWVGYS